MKTLLLSLFLGLCVPLFAQSPENAPAAVIPVVDTLAVTEIGDAQYYVIADKLDSLYTNVRVVVQQVKDANPQNATDWVRLFIELITSGLLAGIATQSIKLWNMAKDFALSIPKSRYTVIIISAVVGFGWLYFLDGLDHFSFENLFSKIAQVYLVAQVLFMAKVTAFKEDKYQEAKAIKAIDEAEAEAEDAGQ